MSKGLLNGRGCYDSMIRGEDESSLYLSIRHHNTSFLLEQRKALALQEKEVKKSQQEIVDGEINEWLAVGALPFARTCIKFLFMLLVWPFYFSFYQLPQLAITKVITPMVDKVKKIVERIVRPVVNGFLRIYRPIAAVCRKIHDLYQSLITILERHFLAVCAFMQKSKVQIYTYVISPPERFLKKCRAKVAGSVQRFVYMYRAFNACCRLLVKYGLDHIRKK